MVKSKAMRCDGADARDEFFLVPLQSLCLQADEPGYHSADKGNAQIDKYAFRNLPDGDIDDRPGHTEQAGGQGDENIGINRKKEDLENRIERHEPRTVLRVA